MMHLLWMALIGLVAGALAKAIMPGRQPGGILVTMLLGLAGSFLMGFLGDMVGWYKEGQGPRFIASTLGAVILLWLYQLYLKNKGGSAT